MKLYKMIRLLTVIALSSLLLSVTYTHQAYAQLCWAPPGEDNQCDKGTERLGEVYQKYMDYIIKENTVTEKYKQPDGTYKYTYESDVEGLSFIDQQKEFQEWLVPQNTDEKLVFPLSHVLQEATSLDDAEEGFIFGHPIRAMRYMARQLTALAVEQIMLIGTFMDAEQQMETQRTTQILMTEAHRDYVPSEELCDFGTNIRSMAASEQRGRYNALALNAYSIARQLGTEGTSAPKSQDEDKAVRWRQFKNTYCDPKDNNWNTKDGSGLERACGVEGAGESERINNDINYTKMIDGPRTINAAFDNTEGVENDKKEIVTPPDREDVIALANNLYGHNVLSRNFSQDSLQDPNKAPYLQDLYMKLRSVAARRNVAQNSYNAIVNLKSAGGTDNENNVSNREFLGALLVEIGIPEDEVFSYIGDNPSYYAQLEILAKKIYQNPDFFANLYDTPSNVKRKSVALKAIELMLDRAIYESQLRREMATSVLLSTKLRGEFETLNDSFTATANGGS